MSFTIVAMKFTKTTQLTIFDLSLVLKIHREVICTSLVMAVFLLQPLIESAAPSQSNAAEGVQ